MAIEPQMGGVMIDEYGKAHHSAESGALSAAGRWFCASEREGRGDVVDLEDVCAWQYGPNAHGVMTEGDEFSWQCVNSWPDLGGQLK